MCARCAGTNGDVLNVHTETCFHSVKQVFLTFLERLKRMLGSSLIDNFLFSMNGPHMGYHVLQRFTKETLESLPILSLRIGRTRNVPDSTNHSLYLTKLFNSSYPEGKRWILPFFFCSIIERSALARCNILIIRSKKEHSSDYLFSDLRAIHTTPHHTTPNHPTTQPPNHARHTT